MTKDTGHYRLTKSPNRVIIYTCSNLEGVDGDRASLVLCCELATRDNSVDNLWIIPVTTGVAFEQQNFSMNYPQVIHNHLEVIHSLSTGEILVIHSLSTDLYTGYAHNILIMGREYQSKFLDNTIVDFCVYTLYKTLVICLVYG